MVLYRTLDDLDTAIRDRVVTEMAPDEHFLAGAIQAEAELKRFRLRFLITDRQILTIKRGWIRTRTRSMPLSAITNIETSETSMLKLRIDAMGDINGEYLFPCDDGQKIVRVLREQLAVRSEAA